MRLNAQVRRFIADEDAQELVEYALLGVFIGVVSVLGENGGTLSCPWASDIRLRFAAQSAMVADVELLLDEVEALYCAGPAGGSGVRRRLTPRLASASCLIERKFASPRVTILGDRA